MKQVIYCLVAMVLMSQPLFAQEENVVEKWNTPYPVQAVEGEVFAGFSFPADSYHHATAKASMEFGLALRYNFPNSPFDFGLQVAFTTVQRDIPVTGHYPESQTNRILSLTATGAYNFRQGHKVNPFAGIGIGVGRMDVVGDAPYWVKGTNILFVPKIGCEFWGFLRVYASAHIIRKGFNSLDVGIGFVIGGRKKRLQ